MRRGAVHSYEFQVTPGSLQEGRTQIRAVLEAGGKQYSEGYSVVDPGGSQYVLLLPARACSE